MKKKTIVIIAVLLLAGTVVILNMPENKGGFGDPTYNHIALYVFDLQKTGEFYERVMKLKKIPDPFNDGKHIWFRTGEHNQLHLILGNTKDQVHPKDNHLSFSVPSVEEFAEHLKKENVPYTGWNDASAVPTIRADGVKQVYFQDPDGLWIEVNNDKF